MSGDMADKEHASIKDLASSLSTCASLEPEAFQDDNRPSALQKAALQFYKEGLYRDVTVVVQGSRFPAHRMVLASLSDFFLPLLKMDETKYGEVAIDCDYVTPEAFDVLLEYAYTGRVKMNQDNVQNILLAADYLTVRFVRDSCEHFMSNNLDCDNICDAIKFSSNYSAPYLHHRAQEFLSRNLYKILKTQAFLELDPDFLVSFFDNDELVLYKEVAVRSAEKEKLVLEAVLRFLAESPSSKSFDHLKLLHTVRLPIIPKNEVMNCVQKFNSVKNTEVWKNYFRKFDSAREYIEYALRGNRFAETAGVAKGIPASWFRSRLPSPYSIVPGHRYAWEGQIAICSGPPKPEFEDPNLELSKIELWIRRWDDRPVIGAIRTRFRKVGLDGVELEYARGEVKRGWEYHTVELRPHEHIVSVDVGSCWLIDRLRFKTDQDRDFGVMGGPGGSERRERAQRGKTSYLYDISCDIVNTEGTDALYNLMLRWIVFD